VSRLIFVNRFYAPDESATAQLLTDLAEHLANAGERVLVLTSRLDYARGATDWPAQESRNGVDVVRLKTTGFGRAVLKLRALDYVSFYLSAWLAVMRHARA
jgi:colanic acid biosynthesis glycosyl transferase WcaI